MNTKVLVNVLAGAAGGILSTSLLNVRTVEAAAKEKVAAVIKAKDIQLNNDGEVVGRIYINSTTGKPVPPLALGDQSIGVWSGVTLNPSRLNFHYDGKDPVDLTVLHEKTGIYSSDLVLTDKEGAVKTVGR